MRTPMLSPPRFNSPSNIMKWKSRTTPWHSRSHSSSVPPSVVSLKPFPDIIKNPSKTSSSARTNGTKKMHSLMNSLWKSVASPDPKQVYYMTTYPSLTHSSGELGLYDFKFAYLSAFLPYFLLTYLLTKLSKITKSIFCRLPQKAP